jgi:hypothetical protein
MSLMNAGKAYTTEPQNKRFIIFATLNLEPIHVISDLRRPRINTGISVVVTVKAGTV